MAEEVTKLIILIIILNLQIRSNVCQNSHQQNCPKRDGFYALHNGCSHSCASDSDCVTGGRCLCDQKCGLSCINEPKDCSQPQHSANGYAILPNPPINNFGQRILFGCARGVLYGSRTLRCLSNGNWSGPIPQCFEEEVPCGNPPPSPEHSSWTISGANLTFVCEESHVLDGEAEIICSRTGAWSPARGQCLPHLCAPPGRSANVIQIGLNYSVSSTVYYKCEIGYNLHGPVVRTCLENRTWSGRSPVCVAKTCPQLTPGTHLTIRGSGVGGSHMVHDVVQFACSEGFTLTSYTNCTCQTNGQWSCGGVPNCTAIRCQLSNPTGRLRYSVEPAKDWLNYNEEIGYKCIDPSMVIHGDAIRTCYDANRLNGTEPSCKLKCEELGTTPSNAIRINSTHAHLHHGGYIIYVCQKRYRMIGTNRFVCQDGQWTTGDFPKCVFDESGHHDYQIRVSNTFTMVNETVIAHEGDQHLEMSCKVRSSKLPKWYFNLGSNLLRGSMETRNGWHKLILPPLQRSMSGNYSCVVRGDSGKFVNISLVVRAWCPDLGPIANGARHPKKGIMQVGDFVNFECDTGYHISGMSTIGCRAGGTWSGPKPACLIDNCEMNLPSVLHSVLIERTYETAENLTGNLTVSCKIGFERIGDEMMYCKDAKWTYTVNRQPSCQKNSTVQIRDEINKQLLDHGTVVVRENDTLHLSCILPGFSTKFNRLKDGRYYNSSLLLDYFSNEDVGKYACQKEGDGTTVQIIDVKILPKCIDIRHLENGYLSEDDASSAAYYHGDTIDFKCNEGYQLFGSSDCRCHEGKWFTEIAPPICLPDINVTITTDPISSRHHELQQYEGKEIILTCTVESKYGLEDLIDKYSFGWSFKGNVVPNGTFYEEAKSKNNVLRLRIRSMIHDFEGSYSCGTKLTQTTVFVRMLKHCPDIHAPSNGRVDTSLGFARPRTSTFSCNARHRLEGHRVLHCLANGQWDRVKPTCKATECEPITIQNGRLLGASFSVGSILSFECNEGFSVIGPKESLTCLADGTWNSSVPICTPLCDQKSCPLGKKCQVVNDEAVCVCLQMSDCVQDSSLTVADRVCGSNAKTFPSSCHLHVDACVETGSQTLTLLHRGTCEIGGRCRSKPIDSYRAAELGKQLDFGQFYFNGSKCVMAPFGYGLQIGHGFDDKSQCEQICIRQNACLVPHVEGPCDQSDPRWAYDVGIQGCREFNYSGCGGNENNFETKDQCIQTCPNHCLACERTISLSELCGQNTTFILSHVTRVNSYATGIAKFRLTTSHVARPVHKVSQPMNEELDLQELSLNRNQDVCFCPRLFILTTPYLISIDDQQVKISDPKFAEPWDLKLQTQFLATRSCFSYIGKLAFNDDTSLFRHL